MNWKVRLLNPQWWLAMVPAVLVCIQAIGAPFGYVWDFEVLGVQLAGIVTAVFAVLTLLGVSVDPTTQGVGDSELALTYDRPKPKEA